MNFINHQSSSGCNSRNGCNSLVVDVIPNNMFFLLPYNIPRFIKDLVVTVFLLSTINTQ